MDQQYDENLTQNPFYCCLISKHSSLFEKATDARWIICVPRLGSLSDTELTEADFESHILITEPDSYHAYKTVNKKMVLINNNVITTDHGFSHNREISILFEETFFNKREESYRVLCINQPLEGSCDVVDDDKDPALYSLCRHSAEEYANLLWGTAAKPKTRKLLANMLSEFQKALEQVSNPNLKHIQVSIASTDYEPQDISVSHFNKALDILMKDPHTKELQRCDQAFEDNIRLAIENHLMYSIHKKLFPVLCTCLAMKDARLNKITRNLSHIQLQHLGVRIEFCQNVPLARKELSNFTLHRTPSGKIRCIKKTVAALIKSRDKLDEPLALTTDDLLPILVFLVIKADVTNWWAHFQHMTSFHFSCTNYDNEYGFYLATMEAALEHVSGGKLLDEEPDECVDMTKVSPPDPQTTLWEKQDETSASVTHLYQFVREKNKAAIIEILQKSQSRRKQFANNKDSSSTMLSLCHPLCNCDRCLLILKSAKQQDASHVSIHSRDSRGYTVLHVAAFYGHVEIVDVILQLGALVNGADYFRQTPLHLASKHGHQAATLLLLHNGAMFNAKDSLGNTPLHLTTARGHDDCAKALVFFDQGSGLLNIDATNDFGDSSLHLASKWGFYSIVKLLLENGASPLIKNKKNHDALKYAHNDNIANLIKHAIVKVTQGNQAEKNLTQMKKSHTFHGVLIKGERSPSTAHGTTLTRSLTQNGLNQPTNAKRRQSATASVVSREWSAVHTGMNSLTGQKDSSIKSDDSAMQVGHKIEKLFKAISDGDINMTKFHLGWLSDSDDDGSDLDLSQHQLCHPLCQCDKCQPLQKFTTASSKSGLHVNSQDHHGNTPLHIATQHGHCNIIELLLRHGASINTATCDSALTPIHLACKHPNFEVLRCLVERDADVNIKESEGNRPLHYCCMMGNTKKATILLKHGAEVNVANKKGNTPLHEAVRWNFVPVVQLLLQHGAMVNHRNSDNKLPIHYAQLETILIGQQPDDQQPIKLAHAINRCQNYCGKQVHRKRVSVESQLMPTTRVDRVAWCDLLLDVKKMSSNHCLRYSVRTSAVLEYLNSPPSQLQEHHQQNKLEHSIRYGPLKLYH
ncbi:hypothetical protein LSH36_326g04083 [Paralvinella palmiformis]|uniref:VPS9 domain-containing protein n=1 Tax=Paralvinella palmiformis TaxID=53620 RepID=A0AAD9JGV6_9ANNE|nr:hypothetical protein LSH36_326g04083 [Paralvinella palmiformis]